MVEATLPTLGAVLVTAGVDAINPCAIGVAILLVATMIKQGRRDQMLHVGGLYVAAIFATYFIAGLGILHFFVNLPVRIASYATVTVASLVVIGGLIEVKDFYWYGKGTSLMIPEKYAEKISESIENLTAPAAVGLGVFVAAVELPCTGGPYLAILTVIAQQGVNMTAYALMVVYNLVFISPLIFIVVAAWAGTYKVQDMKKWKHMNKPKMRMLAGLLMIYLGWLLLVFALGIIKFG